MNNLIVPELVHINVDAADRNEVFSVMSRTLLELGYVRDTFESAIATREATFPTGLAVSGGVAIPHTDAEHVLKDAVSIATLKNPVGFQEMAGDTDDELDISVVFMLVLGASGNHLAVLQKLIGAVQDEHFIRDIRMAASPENAARIANAALDL